MPLTAFQRSTGEVVCILDYPNPRAVLRKGDLECKLCGAQMMVVQAVTRAKHFRHFSSERCTSTLGHHPESAEHAGAKVWLLRALERTFKGTVKPELEVPIPEAGRIADILLTFNGGWQVAHEVQLSRITPLELGHRTDAYHHVGIEVYWWLGGEADTQENREWCLLHIGQCGQVRFELVEEAFGYDDP